MSLDKVRRRIDVIDSKLVRLLNERMEWALRTRKLKGEVEDSGRERDVMETVRRHSQGVISPEFSEKIFGEIIGESKRMQGLDLKLAGFQGEHGAYSEIAAKKYAGDIAAIPCRTFEDVFEGVENRQLDFGVVPVENSLAGAVSRVNDLLVETGLKIVGEVRVPINHCLLVVPGTDHREIKAAYSHPQALAQCRDFLSRNKIEPKPFYDTAGAAKMLAKETPESAAAIASSLCARMYNLEIVKENIINDRSNSTRFLVLSREAGGEDGDKCSITFSTKHKAGALFSMLKLFADASINLTRIESRPMRNDPGNYAFLLDFQGSAGDAKVKEVLSGVEKESSMYRFLGCYKEAKA